MNSLNTYLETALKENKIMRWPDSLMPLKIYIAPFQWYQKSKQQESYFYYHFISEALDLWSKATNGIFTFTITRDYHNSNVNIIWRRVNRKSLGLCTINGVKDHMIFSAEVEIGISDGILHAAYQDLNEVKHTIIHEMGHVIGLPHSPHKEDMMFVPHQYGVVDLTQRDINSAKWLYMMDPGFNPAPFLEDWGLKSNSSIDELIWVYENQDKIDYNNINPQSLPETNISTNQNLSIEDQQNLLAYKNLYNLSLQKIKVDINKKKTAKPAQNIFTKNPKNKKG